MSQGVITSSEQIGTAWLGQVLRESGALLQGDVRAVEVRATDSAWSRIVRLRPHYDVDAEGELPQALLLKICADPEGTFGPSEVHYYTRDYASHPGAPLPRCFHAAYQAEPRAYHLLLEDLSETHGNAFELEPTLERGCATADALAQLHAPYWGNARLAALGRSVPGPEEIERYFAHVSQGLEPLLGVLGSSLDPSWHQCLLRIFAEQPRNMPARARRDAGFTLIHGDLNPGNILWPRKGHSPVFLIDRQPFDWALTCWLGASDVARMMVVPWSAEQRRAWQFPVLRQYQASLARAGIELSWEELTWDYRFSVLLCIESCVEWCVLPEDRQGKRWLWEQLLQRSLVAYFDLHCDEL